MAQLQEEGSQNLRLPHGGSNPATVKDCKEQIRILDDGFFGWVKAPGLCRSRDEYPWAASVGTLWWINYINCWNSPKHVSVLALSRTLLSWHPTFEFLSWLSQSMCLTILQRCVCANFSLALDKDETDNHYCLLMISYWFLCRWLSHPREVSPTRSSSDASRSFTTNSMKRCSRFGPKSSLLDSNCASGGAGVSHLGWFSWGSKTYLRWSH